MSVVFVKHVKVDKRELPVLFRKENRTGGLYTGESCPVGIRQLVFVCQLTGYAFKRLWTDNQV